tara:strand:+ start:121 stop:612 length:492 start_codon:yes stop_codon:yes gene_type:complete
MEHFLLREIDPTTIDKERRRVLAELRSVFASELVHEIGSTAIPGIIGKQDLDFLVLVPPGEFDRARSELDQRYRRNPKQMSNEAYQGYKVESALDVAIQLTIKGGRYDTFLDFLDQLRESPILRAGYNRLKRSFNGRPMEDYRNAKREFIERALDSATGKGSS